MLLGNIPSHKVIHPSPDLNRLIFLSDFIALLQEFSPGILLHQQVAQLSIISMTKGEPNLSAMVTWASLINSALHSSMIKQQG